MKKVIVFLVFVCLSFFSCRIEETGVFFDSQKFNSNKAVWEEKQIENYSYNFKVWGSAGMEVQGYTKETNNIADTKLFYIENKPYDEIPQEKIEQEIKSLTERGYYLKDVTSIFNCILQLFDEEKSDYERLKNTMYSISVKVSYNEFGVPINIDIQYSPKKNGIDGLWGPEISISDFTVY